MKKQKLAVCVLSAALMIGAATLTSYAAEGWQQSGNSWIYVDNNGNKVTNTWKKGADNLWRYLVLLLHQRKDGIRRLVQDRRQVLLLRR